MATLTPVAFDPTKAPLPPQMGGGQAAPSTAAALDPEHLAVSLVRQHAQRYGVDPDFAERVLRAEAPKGFDPKGVNQKSGATGLMQLLPGTFNDMKVGDDISDPAQNTEAGVKYLKQQLDAFGGDQRLAAAAYNYGPQHIKENGLNGIPDETRAYVQKTAQPKPGIAERALSAITPKAEAAESAAPATPVTPATSVTPVSFDPERDAYGYWGTRPQPAITPKPGAGLFSDLGHELKIGADEAAAHVRELVGKIPLVGQPIVAGLDAADAWLHGGTSSQALLKSDIEAQRQALSPEMQAAQQKEWWDDNQHWFGPALTDWRSWVGGLAQSAPEQALMMFPAIRLGRAVAAAKYGRDVAAGVAKEVAAQNAAKLAARVATVSGAVTGGLVMGAGASEQTREQIMALTPEQLRDSDALRMLQAQGLSFEQARAQLAEDVSSQAFLLTGVAAGAFAGFGDRIIAKALGGQLSGGLASRVAKTGLTSSASMAGLSAATQAAQNKAMQAAVPGTPIMAHVPAAAVAGAAQGMLMGAPFGLAGGAHEAQPAPPPTLTEAARAEAPPPPPSAPAAPAARPPGAPLTAGARAVEAAHPPIPTLAPEGQIAPKPEEKPAKPAEPTVPEAEPKLYEGERPPTIIPATPKPEAPAEPEKPVSIPAAPTKESIDEAAHEAATSPKNNIPEPSAAQKEAGNYQKGPISLHGLDISIENPEGSQRSNLDAEKIDAIRESVTGDAKRELFKASEAADKGDYETALDHVKRASRLAPGNADLKKMASEGWANTMTAHYGYFKGTVGKDKDHIDVFLGPQAHDPDAKSYVVDQINPKTSAFDEHKVMMGYPDEAAARKSYLSNYAKGWKGLGAITEMDLPRLKAWLADREATKKAIVYKKPEIRPEMPFKHGDRVEVRIGPDEWIPAKVRDVDAASGKVWVFHGRPERYDEGKSETFNVADVRKLIARPTEKPAKPPREQAKADLDAALSDLGAYFDKQGFTKHVVPEHDEGALLPIVARLTDAAIRLGYHSFKDAARFVIKTIREKFGEAAARSISLDHVQGAYISVASKHEGTTPKTEVIAVSHLHELEEPKWSSVTEAVHKQLIAGKGFRDIVEARKLGESIVGHPIRPGTPDAKLLDEAVEAGVTRAAREIVASGTNRDDIFDRLLKLHDDQPSFNVRTSTSVRNQAYSTPAPIAYLASRLAGIDLNKSVYEPTAGNGMLLMGANPKKTFANEIEGGRLSELKAQGFEPTQKDATTYEPPSKVDAVIANPPFGYVKDEAGQTLRWDVEGIKTPLIDHAIVLKSLQAMKDDGRAALIIASPIKELDRPELRSDAYNGLNQRAFYKTLFDNYNVVDHFTVDGDLYSKQGAAWPVDVLVIDGRGKSALSLPAVKVPRTYDSWEGLKNVLRAESPPHERVEPPAEPAPPQPAGGGHGLGGGEAGGPRLGGERGGEAGGPPGLRPGPDRGQFTLEAATGGEPATDAPVRVDRGLDREPISGASPEANAHQEPYEPASKAPGLQTLVPKNMKTSVKEAFEALHSEVGDVDEYVGRELGYSKDELHRYFGAEQVDALALAIKAIRDGSGFIIGDQCVAGETRIFDPLTGAHVAIEVLAKRGKPITVLALTPSGLTPSWASAPFKKGVADLYRVELNDGRSITVTAGHRFLTPSGWRAIDDGLREGHFLACAEGLPECNLGFAPSTHGASARHSNRTPLDSAARCSAYFHPHDAQLRTEEDSAAGDAPSQGGAREHNQPSWHADAPATSLERSHPHPAPDRRARNSFSPSESRDLLQISSQGISLCEQRSRQSSQSAGPFLDETSTPRRARDEVQPDLCAARDRIFSASPVDHTGWRPIRSITFVRRDVFYDMWVPGPENYVAEGMLHHNTGVGKGRVVAGIIRFALKEGKTPIFVTEKPNLYKDIYRDLTDIGMRDARPIMTNSAEDVALTDDGSVILKGGGAAKGKTLQKLIDQGHLGDHNMIFTTYNQLQTVQGGQRTVRMDFAQRFANGGVLILDESHNAGGSEKKEWGKPKLDRATFVRALINAADSVFYSSATYAKRPDVMDLYSKTDMRLAVDKLSDLAGAIRAGGVPLQQAVAAMLSKAGQYLRRERSFDGIKYAMQEAAVDRAQAQVFASVMRSVIAFDKAKKGGLSELKKEVKAQAKSVSEDGSTGSAGVTSTNFTSIMHNLVEQWLLAAKVKPAVDRAMEMLGSGEKPVLTVANTMGSFIEEYAETHGIKPNDAIGISFRDLLMRYLERTRNVLIKDYHGRGTRHYLTDGELGSAGLSAYDAAKAAIESVNFDIPLSPIDFVKGELTKAGYKVGEITARTHLIDYSSGSPILRMRPAEQRSIKGRNKAITDFNNGALDAMVLNQAGATGLSLHASEKFKDQRKRHMIVVQPERNVDTHMQMLGRINRTGQVMLPEYTQLVADVPAEMRPAALLAKKLASLNASTTAARGGALTAADVPDFLNEYGDQVVARLMEDNPQWHDMMGEPLKWTDKGIDDEDAARKVSGKIALLPIEDQEQLYDAIQSNYKELLAEKDRLGENALEAKRLDLDAKVLKRTPIFEGRGGSSPFAEGASAESLSVKRMGKPYTSEELHTTLAKALDLPEDVKSHEIEDAGVDQADERSRKLLDEAQAYKREVLDELDTEAAKKAQELRIDVALKRLYEAISNLPVGRKVRLSTMNGDLDAVVAKVERRGVAKSPVALGPWRFTFAVNDAMRTVTLSASRLYREGTAPEDAMALGYQTYGPPRDEFSLKDFDKGQSESREQRTMLTGNLLAAFGKFKRGRIVNFTDEHGGIRQGILMPASFDLDTELNALPIEFPSAESAIHFLDAGRDRMVESSDEKLYSVKIAGRDYRFSVNAAKGEGGNIYLNPKVLAAAGQDFVKVGQTMRLDTDRDTAIRVLDAINAAGFKAVANTFRQEAKEAIEHATGKGYIAREEGSDYNVSYGSGRVDPEQFTPLEGAAYYTRVQARPSAYFASGIAHARNAADVAHITAPLRKEAQESVLALVVDKGYRVLGILRHSVGAATQSAAYPAELLGAVHAMPGARGFWLVHQHPSGNPIQSTADALLNHDIARLAEGLGVKYGGSVVVAPGGWASFELPKPVPKIEGRPFKIEPKARSEQIPILTRRTMSTTQLPSVSSPEVAQQVIPAMAGGRSGIALLSVQHRPVAFVPMGLEEMGRLRSGEQSTGGSALLAAKSRSNAMSMIAYLPRADYRGLEAALPQMLNLKTFGKKADLLMLDAIGDTPISLASHPKWSSEPAEYQARGTPQTGISEGVAKDMINRFRARFPEGPAIEAVRSLTDIPEAYRARLDYRTQALYVPDTRTVYIPLDRIGSRERMAQLLAHEAIGHFGVNRLTGYHFDQVQRDVFEHARAKDLDYTPDVLDPEYATVEAVRRDYPDADNRLIAQEVLARMAEQNASAPWYERALARIRDALVALGRRLGLKIEPSRADLYALVRRAGDELRDTPRGARADQIEMPEQAPLEARAPVLTRTRPGWIERESPQMQESLRKAGIWWQPPTWSERFAQWRQNWQGRMRQGMFDTFAPIEELDPVAYMKARLSRNSDAPLEAQMMHGPLRYDPTGGLTVDYEKGGFVGHLARLNGEHDRFLAWVAGNRARRLMAEGRERNFTKEDIQRLISLNRGRMDDGRDRAQVYAQTQEQLARYNKAINDVAERSGIFDPNTRAEWERYFYLPFYRFSESADNVYGPRDSRGLVNQYFTHPLKGGEDVLGDPLQNVIANWAHVVNASLKNEAARDSLLAAERLGRAIEVPETAARQIANSIGEKRAAMYFLDRGFKRWFVVEDPMLIDALRGIGFTGMRGPIIDAMGKFKRWMTFGTTLGPGFKLRLLIRDTLQAVGTNPMDYNILSNVLTGWQGTKTGPHLANLLAGGGYIRFGSYLEGDRAAHAKQLIETQIPGGSIVDSPAKLKAFARIALDKWRHVGERMEGINRSALYQQLRADGMSHLEASYRALDVMDYANQGSWAAIRLLAQVVPFFNARLQGLYKIGRGAIEDPQRFATVLGAMAVASIMLYWNYKDDPDFQKREDWDRENYWWFKVGDNAYRIPRPFEMGALATFIERGFESMVSDEFTGREFGARIFQILLGQLSLNPTPQAVKPLIELAMNRNAFTGRPIETAGMERLSVANRYSPWTSATARLAGKAGLLSPVQIDSLVYGYLGWMGAHILAAADLATRPMMGLPPEPASDWENFFSMGFARELPAAQSRYVTQLYDQGKQFQEYLGDVRMYMMTGAIQQASQMLKEHPERIELAQLYTASESLMAQFNQKARRVQESATLTPDEKKRELQAINELKNQLAKTTVQRARARLERAPA